MSDSTPPTDPAPKPDRPWLQEAQERREAEKKLAETPAGFLLFEYIKLHDSAWSEDNILGMTPMPSQKRVAHVRELFAKAAQFRAALVHTLLHPPEEPNIVRMLDVSTAHLPQQDRSDLVCNEIPGQTVATVHGGLVSAATWALAENEGRPPEGYSDAMNAIMQHALARRCQYVMFDADAPELPGFPTFED
jgi:DNA-directed RNA polymerase subunit H (RpoH/RPB5)